MQPSPHCNHLMHPLLKLLDRVCSSLSSAIHLRARLGRGRFAEICLKISDSPENVCTLQNFHRICTVFAEAIKSTSEDFHKISAEVSAKKPFANDPISELLMSGVTSMEPYRETRKPKWSKYIRVHMLKRQNRSKLAKQVGAWATTTQFLTIEFALFQDFVVVEFPSVSPQFSLPPHHAQPSPKRFFIIIVWPSLNKGKIGQKWVTQIEQNIK